MSRSLGTTMIIQTHRLVMLLSFIMLLLVLVSMSYFSSYKTQSSYGVANDGTIFDINYFYAPIKSKNDIGEWAAQVSSMALSLNFNKYTEQLALLRPFFSDHGWKKYSEALTTSGYLDRVKKQKLYITAINNKLPMIPKWGYLKDGEFYWSVQVPQLLSIQTASQVQKKNRMVYMLIKLRPPVIANNNGCGYEKVWEYMKENMSIAQMYNEGCRVEAFRAAGLTNDQLSKAGFSAKMLSVEGNGLSPMVVDSFISK
jgi:intracellular multiplication protein IcmL